jgi:hypothetical protein
MTKIQYGRGDCCCVVPEWRVCGMLGWDYRDGFLARLLEVKLVGKVVSPKNDNQTQLAHNKISNADRKHLLHHVEEQAH